ncbi:STAS domain-containing protein [Actinomadura bangladeshensis]|uniref:Anti-sigma factor antagonist n=1 Tax=Actinomadura bangladeshensis TaxID=453573 RepID=A0A6L9QE41_9ACTN|nr:STAS domain-containing protein [Actinomadura bangladeshensis]
MGLARRRHAQETPTPHGTWRTAWLPRRSRDSVPDVELNVSTASQGGHAVVTATGELDLYTAPRLQAALAGLLREQVTRIVVDLSGVEFCDSTGMNVLLSAMKRLKEQGGALELAAPRPAVRRILQVTGLDTVFTVTEKAPVLDAG